MTDLVKREDVLRLLMERAAAYKAEHMHIVAAQLFVVHDAIAALPSEPAPEVGTDTMANPLGGYSTERPGL